MAKTGIARIDDLFAGVPGTTPLAPGDSDREAVGALQDLLIGQGHSNLPGALAPDRGIFGSQTSTAVRRFRAGCGLPDSDSMDGPAIKTLATMPSPEPVASRAYLALALDLPFSGMTKVLGITAVMEGQGKFTAINANTDRAGLSFGIIQWAQKPGRLSEILAAFQAADAGEFVRIFGAGGQSMADDLLRHVQMQNGGVDAAGITTDPRFDLVAEPWLGRFREAGRLRIFQTAQIQAGLAAFDRFYGRLCRFAPVLTSERSVAFMLDLANQHGEAGAEAIFTRAARPDISPADLLQAMAEESVNRVRDPFKKGTRSRRESFLTTSLLSDDPFRPSQEAEAASA